MKTFEVKMFEIRASIFVFNENYDSIIVFCESKKKLQKLIDNGVFYERYCLKPCKKYSIEEIDKIDKSKKVFFCGMC